MVIAWGTSELGVDVQKHETTVRSQAMAQRYFTEEEQAYVGGDAGRFYEIWTKKESYIKYTGEGLKRNLRSFSVLEPEPPVRYCYHTLEGGYSLSLCAAADACAPELLDVRKLFEI